MAASQHQIFVSQIERCLDEGVFLFRKPDLLPFCGGDESATKSSLAHLETQGVLMFLKPWDEAKEDQPVVRLLRYVTRKSPWPNWPPAGPIADQS